MRVILILAIAVFATVSHAQEEVLVFTKTAGYRHESIETGVQALKELGEDNNFQVTQTEDANLFNIETLKQYGVVVFLSTTQDVLNETQEKAFKAYINNGGSFMGIHAATDTEFDWEWYGKLVGAYFVNHPRPAKAKLKVVNSSHPSTKHLSEVWEHFDEWYNFKSISSDINVLLELDETSYRGGTNGDFHPIAWYQEFDGGRMFYTGLGHTKESYQDPTFRQHLLGGIMYCLKKKL
ncbi:ThuA domain-containing protein [Flavobacteriaceae bacterium XHP0103]|uniref:ThuA domain-containing protein n=1 Tax=Marixanthotalea marina TaxID=2844359 RepID=UPI002989F941|nr:ThuA domain-containing protein [Marixanthotalea marina]MBU3820727.1 ThuA domain-containing protein [Marixanthotalea marina]